MSGHRVMLAGLALLMASAGCTQFVARASGPTVRTVVEPVIAEQVGEDLSGPFTTCVIANATSAELVKLAADATSVEGPAPDVVILIADILSRPETQSCATAA